MKETIHGFPVGQGGPAYYNIERTLLACSCALSTGHNFVPRHFSSTPGGTRTHNPLMAVHNNNNILMVHYEDIPDGDKDVIGKATEEF